MLEGLSKYFGDDPLSQYFTSFMIDIYIVAYPFILIAIVYYFKEMRSMKQPPLLAYCVTFYILFFSLIAHKECRFILPTVPFCFLMLGYLLFRKIKSMPRLIQIFMIIFILSETITLTIHVVF